MEAGKTIKRILKWSGRAIMGLEHDGGSGGRSQLDGGIF